MTHETRAPYATATNSHSVRDVCDAWDVRYTYAGGACCECSPSTATELIRLASRVTAEASTPSVRRHRAHSSCAQLAPDRKRSRNGRCNVRRCGSRCTSTGMHMLSWYLMIRVMIRYIHHERTSTTLSTLHTLRTVEGGAGSDGARADGAQQRAVLHSHVGQSPCERRDRLRVVPFTVATVEMLKCL